MHYTISGAAKEAGVAKSTVSKAVNSGALSVSEVVGNTKRIDPAELKRWMDEREKRSPNTKTERTETVVETAVLEVEKTALQRQVEDLRAQLEDVKGQRDSWQEQAERNTRLLENKTEEAKPTGIMGRLFGRSGKAA